MMSVCPIHKGMRFSSLEELEHTMTEFEAHQKITFYKRNAKTLKSYFLGKSWTFEREHRLRYFTLTYTCLKSGFCRSKSAGIRPNQKTFKSGCPAQVSFKFIDEALQVTSLNVDHNHEVSDETFKNLPKARRLSLAEKRDARMLMAENASKKYIRDYLKQKTGKEVKLRDLVNLSLSKDSKSPDIPADLSSDETTHGTDIDSIQTDDMATIPEDPIFPGGTLVAKVEVECVPDVDTELGMVQTDDMNIECKDDTFSVEPKMEIVSQSLPGEVDIPNVDENYKNMLIQSVAKLGGECSAEGYGKRIHFLKGVISLWDNGEEIALVKAPPKITLPKQVHSIVTESPEKRKNTTSISTDISQVQHFLEQQSKKPVLQKRSITINSTSISIKTNFDRKETSLKRRKVDKTTLPA